MTERGNGAGTDAPTPEPATQPEPAVRAAPPTDENDPLDLKARLERFGEILARGLDLAEAGMNLGLTVLGTVGNAAQTKIIERMLSPTSEQPPPAAANPAPAAPPEPPQSAAASYGITNRLPLRPGAAVSISFSVNNESAAQPRTVRLVVEDFAGERFATRLPAESLTVAPGEKAIAPMDFEKFVLEGTIPAATPPDNYRGSVVVLGETPMRIPVLLVVEAAA